MRGLYSEAFAYTIHGSALTMPPMLQQDESKIDPAFVFAVGAGGMRTTATTLSRDRADRNDPGTAVS